MASEPLARVCLCPACCESPGQTYTESWRRECEARDVLRKSKEQRQAYYAAVAKFRGPPAAQQLIDDVKEAYERARNQPAGV